MGDVQIRDVGCFLDQALVEIIDVIVANRKSAQRNSFTEPFVLYLLQIVTVKLENVEFAQLAEGRLLHIEDLVVAQFKGIQRSSVPEPAGLHLGQTVVAELDFLEILQAFECIGVDVGELALDAGQLREAGEAPEHGLGDAAHWHILDVDDRGMVWNVGEICDGATDALVILVCYRVADGVDARRKDQQDSQKVRQVLLHYRYERRTYTHVRFG